MDKLAAFIANKRKSTEQEFRGRKFVKRSDLEEARLRKRREEELAQTQKREPAEAPQPGEKQKKRTKAAQLTFDATEAAEAEEDRLLLPEVFRRLRALEQPVTLFGENDVARRARLKSAGASLQLKDEQRGAGQQSNTLLDLQRAQKAGSKGRLGSAAAEKAKPADDKAKEKAKDNAEAGPAQGGGLAPPADLDQAAQLEVSTSGRDATMADGEEAEMMAAFKVAADTVKAQRAEASMCTEDRILKHLKAWTAAWEGDLDLRSADIRESGAGIQATTQYKQTMAFFQPLFSDLKKRRVIPEMLAGLWMIVDTIQQRNYLYAYDIYMRLAIGNAPWPIGVTSVGIHERSSREKISHVTGMNVAGAAHVMNDEASRKYLQAIKRLLTFMQRAYPTDPSRSVDFDGFRNEARGAAGAGSDKLALLDAERAGTTWKDQGLRAAPHFLDTDGTVKVPQSWKDMVKSTMQTLQEHPDAIGSPARSGSPATSGRASPALQDTPRSPGRAANGSAAATNKPLAAMQQQDKQQRPGSPLRPS